MQNYSNGYNPRDIDSSYIQEANIVSFIKSTYKLFALSLLTATLGAFVSLTNATIFNAVSTSLMLILVVEIGLIFAISYTVKRNPSLGMMLLVAFTFMTGLSISPLLAYAIGIGASGAIVNAFLSSTLIFASLSLFAVRTTKDFTQYGKILFIVLAVVFVVSLLNAFLFKTPLLSLVISGIAVILFSFYIVYDTQNIIKGNYATPTEAALALYLDFFNLFISLLQIILAFTSGRGND